MLLSSSLAHCQLDGHCRTYRGLALGGNGSRMVCFSSPLHLRTTAFYVLPAPRACRILSHAAYGLFWERSLQPGKPSPPHPLNRTFLVQLSRYKIWFASATWFWAVGSTWKWVFRGFGISRASLLPLGSMKSTLIAREEPRWGTERADSKAYC